MRAVLPAHSTGTVPAGPVLEPFYSQFYLSLRVVYAYGSAGSVPYGIRGSRTYARLHAGRPLESPLSSPKTSVSLRDGRTTPGEGACYHTPMTTIRHHRQAIQNIEVWIEQSNDPEFIRKQEERADWHASEINRLQARNRVKDQRRRTGPNWQVLLDRVQAKIDRKERTLDYWREQLAAGRNPAYFRSMTEITEFDLAILRAEKKAITDATQ